MELIKVIEATYIRDFQIDFKFSDGSQSVIDLESHLSGEIFDPIKDKRAFKKFKVNPWTIEWENGADFSPEFLYRLSLQNKGLQPRS